MQFPQQAAYNYRNRLLQNNPNASLESIPTAYDFNADLMNYTSTGNLSPAFAPSTPHYNPSASASGSSTSTPFLEVPSSQAAAPTGFGYGTSSWGAMPSPGFPPQGYTTGLEGDMYDMSGLSLSGAPGFRGGFVSPLPIWT